MKKVLLFVTAAFLLIGCGQKQQEGITGKISIDGSSTVYPITEAVAEEFMKEYSRVRVTVGTSGSGGGFQKFTSKETDISDASRPIKETEISKAKKNGVQFIELPVAFDGLSVVVNPKNDWVDYLTVEDLERMWKPEAQGKITRWSQVRSEWPDRELNLYGPGVSSGTFDYFTEAVVGREGASRGDYTASEDDNVLVQGVAGDINALGFFGFAYYHENQDRLKIVPIDDGNPDNGKGPIAPTFQTIGNGTYQPLARPLFIYVREESANRAEVQEFIHFFFENAPQLVQEVGYIPLSDTTYAHAMDRFEERVTGSVFSGGSQVGVNINELLQTR
ncbi:MAG: PstS family phosphate ABC transporter substrate-binding protein [Candidatus Marinimicrobia bacterium]|nr:PstS family phosphate ABC transporter substrate-binding protein [Candidatus Neomarinimicrobiota bacterium]MCF7828149.1 PstS family phosphate ABC transporter substrate-binding protein [Candidatus Neomarinimicrobiota bacterium]MCF7879676.1 PstS family phosphate ABC transporter substrate-binding protein [Candidatus Neomarinimicrobiota bacterium]